MKKNMNYSNSNSRTVKQLLLILFDSVLLISLFEIAFSIRLGVFFGIGNYPGMLFIPEGTLIVYILSTPIFAIPIFAMFGLYRTVIRFIDFKGLWSIIQSVSLFVIIYSAFLFMVAAPLNPSSQGVPRSVILIYWLLVIVGLLGSRMFLRWFLIRVNSKKSIQNVVIYGAGSAGRELSIALSQSDDYKPVALIDDDPTIQKHNINGLEVVSSDNLGSLILKRKVKEILIAIPSIKTSIQFYFTHTQNDKFLEEIKFVKDKINKSRDNEYIIIPEYLVHPFVKEINYVSIIYVDQIVSDIQKKKQIILDSSYIVLFKKNQAKLTNNKIIPSKNFITLVRNSKDKIYETENLILYK